jgi:hypothetical protein
LQSLVEDGKLARTLPDVHAIRQQVLADLETVTL